MDTVPLLFEGILNNEIIQMVKNQTLPGITKEGVVGKQLSGRPGLPDMFKIKTDLWLNNLKSYCNGNEELFKKLS